MNRYDLIVVGAGGAGMMASIVASRRGKKVLLLEKLPKLGSKLKATGGGKCNVTNTLSIDEFINAFGREGRFMMSALREFDNKALIKFLESIGVQTHSLDGFRVFPTTHNSATILDALIAEIQNLNIDVINGCKVKNLKIIDSKIVGVECADREFLSDNVALATGGLGYPMLGTTGDGFEMASRAGHKIVTPYPAMLPLHTKEQWVKSCRADTVAKVTMKINLPKFKKLKAVGDLIFTKNGIRGPVVLDFAREITPLLEKFKEVPILVNLTKGLNEDAILKHIKEYPKLSILETLTKILPKSVAIALCNELNIDINSQYKNIVGIKRQELLKTLSWTPLTIVGHDGFKMAMITRGGVSLKEIDPNTMMSKKVQGLYFCGEVANIDGPCGGYNLQWAFSSGYLLGSNI